MKYIHYILILGLCVTGFTTSVQAQAKLGLYTTSLSSATPALGDQLSIYTELRNTSTTDTFTGALDFGVANKDGIITNGTLIGKPNFSGITIVLPPASKISALTTVQLDPSYFKVGPEIIIVWPITTATPSTVLITDSAKASITITAPTGIEDVSAENIKAYVFNERLVILNNGSKPILEKVQIFDVIGRPIAYYKLNGESTAISVTDLPKGIYIAEITTTTGQRKAIKFVR